ncbi:MAG TPA: RNA polymerase sigma factor SigZ [Nitrospiraceae bacterium]|nr:RNA polymerase sigma factor SigZ [Nitrospiraceae bacterium]
MAEAVTEIWQQVHDSLRAFIAKRVANDAEAEDILQEVFLRIHRRLDSVNDPRRLVSWVYQITRHAIIDHYRANGKRMERQVGLAGELEALPTSASLNKPAEDTGRLRAELAGCLRPMIAQLPPDYREAVTLVELDGLTQQEAATRMELSLSGMKSRVQRGRRQLKQMLDDCCLIQLDGRRGVADFEVRASECNPCGNAPVGKR